MPAALEHVNLTVTDADRFAEGLCTIFDWKIRWSGPVEGARKGVHVGTDTGYIALFDYDTPRDLLPERYSANGAMNHLGITVDDLDAAEARLRKAGYEPHHHADYEPGRRLYFMYLDDVEIEVVQYG